MKVLLSINPEHMKKILNGTGELEFQRGVFRKPDIESVVIYSTMPVGKVVAESGIADVIEDKPNIVWEKTGQYAGISKQSSDSYFHNKERTFATEVGNLKIYDQPLHLDSLGGNITAPQSYRYL